MVNIIILSIVALFSNIPLGSWRSKYRKFSFPWILIVHASIPFIISLRLLLEAPSIFIPLFIALAVAGQFIGVKLVAGK